MKIKNGLVISALLGAGLLSVPFNGLAAAAADPGIVAQLQVTIEGNNVTFKSDPVKIAENDKCEIIVNANQDGSSYSFNPDEFSDLAMSLVFIGSDGKETESVKADDIENIELEMLEIGMIEDGSSNVLPLKLINNRNIVLTKDTYTDGINLMTLIDNYGDFETKKATGVKITLNVNKLNIHTETTPAEETTTTADAATTTKAQTTTTGKKNDNPGPSTGDRSITGAVIALAVCSAAAGVLSIRKKK